MRSEIADKAPEGMQYTGELYRHPATQKGMVSGLSAVMGNVKLQSSYPGTMIKQTVLCTFCCVSDLKAAQEGFQCVLF